jgi:DNA-binding MarR family transcriptional regulator
MDTKKNHVNIQPSVEDALVLTILELAAQLTQNGNLITEQVKLTTQQWLIMLYICRDPNIPFINQKTSHEGVFASDIAEALNVSKPNITNLVGSLLEKDLVAQIDDNIDRRRKALVITSKGKQVLEQIETERIKANQSLFGQLNPQERQDMLKYLQLCLSKLKKLK